MLLHSYRIWHKRQEYIYTGEQGTEKPEKITVASKYCKRRTKSRKVLLNTLQAINKENK